MPGLTDLSLSWGDVIKFLSVAVMAGVMYQKLDNVSEEIKNASLESKEFRIRIERLELSTAEIKLELEQIRAEQQRNYVKYEDKRGGYKAH